VLDANGSVIAREGGVLNNFEGAMDSMGRLVLCSS